MEHTCWALLIYYNQDFLVKSTTHVWFSLLRGAIDSMLDNLYVLIWINLINPFRILSLIKWYFISWIPKFITIPLQPLSVVFIDLFINLSAPSLQDCLFYLTRLCRHDHLLLTRQSDSKCIYLDKTSAHWFPIIYIASRIRVNINSYRITFWVSLNSDSFLHHSFQVTNTSFSKLQWASDGSDWTLPKYSTEKNISKRENTA